MLTTFLLSPDERYIITADRDEHIRVSWYPQGYAIERYCLGHEKCVGRSHSPDLQPDPRADSFLLSTSLPSSHPH